MKRRFYGQDIPSEKEIYQMYIKQGMDSTEARRKAKIIHREMDKLDQRESRSWRQIRANEVSENLNPFKEID